MIPGQKMQRLRRNWGKRIVTKKKRSLEPSPYPYEDDEQATVVEYCDLRGFARFRVPNETLTTIKQVKKNKKLGVSSGVPDLFVIVNTKDGHRQLVAVEMKRVRQAKPSTRPDQKRWLADLAAAGIKGRVCYGAAEAIDFLKEIENGEDSI